MYTENHATVPIQIHTITVQICGNFWGTQYMFEGVGQQGDSGKQDDTEKTLLFFLNPAKAPGFELYIKENICRKCIIFLT